MREYIPKDWRCDPSRWQMMIHYCRGYPKWKQEISDIKLAYRASGQGASGGGDVSEVERKVERMSQLTESVEMIEKCCREATENKPYVFSSLLLSVTQKIPLDGINSPVGRKQLSRYRKRFFFYLDAELQKKNII